MTSPNAEPWKLLMPPLSTKGIMEGVDVAAAVAAAVPFEMETPVPVG